MWYTIIIYTDWFTCMFTLRYLSKPNAGYRVHVASFLPLIARDYLDVLKGSPKTQPYSLIFTIDSPNGGFPNGKIKKITWNKPRNDSQSLTQLPLRPPTDLRSTRPGWANFNVRNHRWGTKDSWVNLKIQWDSMGFNGIDGIEFDFIGLNGFFWFYGKNKLRLTGFMDVMSYLMGLQIINLWRASPCTAVIHQFQTSQPGLVSNKYHWVYWVFIYAYFPSFSQDFEWALQQIYKIYQKHQMIKV